MTALWTGLGDKVVDRFSDLLLSPALAFWLGGLIAWVHAHGGVTGAGQGWTHLLDTWNNTLRGDTGPQVVAAIGLLLLVAGSARIGVALTLPTLRLMEGYWPSWVGPLADWRVHRRARRSEADKARWRELYLRRSQLSDREWRELGLLNARRGLMPPDPADSMPTALGDLLKAMETRPRHRYGLDAVICFPRLWLVMPEAARADVAGARAQVDEATRVWLWSLLFVLWTPLVWWSAPAGIVGAMIGYRFALRAAAGFADLVQSCFDLYRGDLYQALAFPRPATDDERDAGTALTAWLERGR